MERSELCYNVVPVDFIAGALFLVCKIPTNIKIKINKNTKKGLEKHVHSSVS